MDMNRMTLKVQEALQAASALAMHRNHQGIDVEHVLAALLEQPDGSAGPILEQTGYPVPLPKPRPSNDSQRFLRSAGQERHLDSFT